MCVCMLIYVCVCVCVYRDELCFLYISLVYIYSLLIMVHTIWWLVSLFVLFQHFLNVFPSAFCMITMKIRICMCVCLCVSRYKSCFYNSSTGACKIAGVYVMLYVYNVPSFLFLQLSNSLYLYKNSIWLYKIGSKIYKISYKACSKGSSDYSMHFLLTRLNWDLKTKSDKRDKLT